MIRCPECGQVVSTGAPATGAVKPTEPGDNGSRDGYWTAPHWAPRRRWWHRRRHCPQTVVWTHKGNQGPWRVREWA